ncbi:hypothetical protein TNCV_4641321 [Trichonephila clavipes]|nr:hypothetical protein TNCV_4641321 [Trichonephila clavipes]
MKNIASCSAGGASNMTGKKHGFLMLIKDDNPNMVLVHCVIHRENLYPRYSGGQGIGSWLARHEFEPSTTKDTPCSMTSQLPQVKHTILNTSTAIFKKANVQSVHLAYRGRLERAMEWMRAIEPDPFIRSNGQSMPDPTNNVQKHINVMIYHYTSSFTVFCS